MAEREKYEPDITKIQKSVEEEAHNLELVKQRNRQLEHLGLEQHYRHMQGTTEEPEKETIIGLPSSMVKPDEEWHDEKRPARARSAEELGPRMETNVTPSQGMVGTAKHSLRGYFGPAKDQPELPHGITGLEELSRLKLDDVEAPSESTATGTPRKPSPETETETETVPEQQGKKDLGGEREPTTAAKPAQEVTPVQQPSEPTTTGMPTPGTLMQQQMGEGKQQGADLGKQTEEPIASTVHRARPLVSNVGDKEPQFEPVPHLLQATRILPGWKQGETEGTEPKREEVGTMQQQAQVPFPEQKQGEMKGMEPEYKQEEMKKPEFEQGGKLKDTGVGVRLGTGMGHGGIRPHKPSEETEGLQTKLPPLETGPKQQQEQQQPLQQQPQTQLPSNKQPSWQEQAMGQSSEWQGGVCPGLEKGPAHPQQGMKQSDEAIWKQQATGQSSEWQGGVCPTTGAHKEQPTSGTEIKIESRATEIPTTLEKDVGEGRAGRLPASTSSDWPVSAVEAGMQHGAAAPVGVESMSAACGLPGAPPEWQGEGRGKVEVAEGDRKQVKESMGIGKDEGGGGGGGGVEQQPEVTGHREQELGGRTQIAQQ